MKIKGWKINRKMKTVDKEMHINCKWEVSKIEITPQSGNVRVNVLFQNEDESGAISFLNPSNLSFIEELVNYWDIYVKDLNQLHNSGLEFGSYEVDIYDEDNSVKGFFCDQIEYDEKLCQ